MNPWTVAYQAPQSMGFPRQGYWSGLPLPPPRDLPDPGIKQASPTLAGRFLTTEPRYMYPNVSWQNYLQLPRYGSNWSIHNIWVDKDVVCVYIYINICVCIYLYLYTHTQNRILLRHKKKEILPFEAMWMGLENIMLSEISQTKKDKYWMISLIYGMQKINECI